MSDTLQILYIEDDEADRLIFRRHLKKSEINAEVDIAPTGQSGIAKVTEKHYDLIFSDFNLPDKNAIQIARSIREVEANVPIVVITSQGDVKQAADVMKAGASDYIPKELLSTQEISKVITNILSIQREKQKARDLENRLIEVYSNTQAILENTNAAIWSFNNNYELIGFNSRCAELYKVFFQKDIREGDNILGILTEEFIKNWKPLFDKALNGERSKIVSGYKTDDGKSHHWELSTNPILGQNASITGVSCFAFDVTQLIQQQEELKKSQEKYRDLVEYNMAMISTQRMDGTITSINEHGARQLGYTIDELIGVNMLDLLSDKSRHGYGTFMEKLKKSHATQGVMAMYDKSGVKKYFAFHNALRTDRDTGEQVISYAQDISERILAERQLESAKKMAEEASRIKTNFLANMSHEIRTPMNAILGFTDIILETELNEEQLESAKTIKEAGGNLLALINDILDFSKIEAGKLTLEKVPFNLKETLQSSLRIFEAKLKEKALKLTLNFDLPEEFLIGDPYRLNQILTNLLSNAIKFTSEGGIEISVVGTAAEEGIQNVRIKVKDSGIGIREDKLDTIFNTFTQASSDTTRKFGGTGLGLSIVKHITELMDGTIKVESEFNKGTTFILDIPYLVSASKQNAQTVVSDTSKFDLEGTRILVCEDNPMNQVLIGRILKKWNANYDLAENGKEGVEKFSKGVYDIVLMDIQMPEMDGYEATQLIRQSSNIPIIAMSAHAMKEKKQECIDFGMNDYVTKPFNQMGLYTAITSSLGRANTPIPGATDLKVFKNELMDLTSLEALSGGSKDFTREIMSIYLRVGPEELAKLKKARANHDPHAQAHVVHKLKSSFGMLGMERTQKLAEIVELKLQSGERPSDAEFDQIISDCEASFLIVKQLEKTV